MIQYRALRLHQFGPVGDTIKIDTLQLPPLAPREVRVRMLLAPIHPADLNIIQGHYGSLPSLPAIIGNEGVGFVEETGPDVQTLMPGQRVITPWHSGAWTEIQQRDERDFLAVPDELSREQAATLAVNPLTAYPLLRNFVDLKPGDWVIQNAANSAVGQAVIEIAKYWGLRTLNLARRPEVFQELKALGADKLLLNEDLSPSRVESLTAGQGVRLGLNTVGGGIVKQMAKCLLPHSPLVTYGGMSGQPIEMGAGLLIFRDIRFVGFWRTQWVKDTPKETVRRCLLELANMNLGMAVEARYPMAEAETALRHAAHSRRTGKIFLTF